MGLEMQTVSLKVGEKTLQQLADLETSLGLFMENRSQILRFAVALTHSTLFTPDKLEHGLIVMQRILCGTTSYQRSLPFKEEK